MITKQGIANDQSAATQLKAIAEQTKNLLDLIGEDVSREGLVKTPERVAKSLSALTSGYQKDPLDEIRSAIFQNESPKTSMPMMVSVTDIEFYSMCEHHMLPFFGKVHIAYYPDLSIVGLSKLPRLVEVFSRRLQVQERLTSQIMNALMTGLSPLGVAVAIEASHMCMMMRGVRSRGSQTFTLSTCGLFDQPEHRSDFLRQIKR